MAELELLETVRAMSEDLPRAVRYEVSLSKPDTPTCGAASRYFASRRAVRMPSSSRPPRATWGASARRRGVRLPRGRRAAGRRRGVRAAAAGGGDGG